MSIGTYFREVAQKREIQDRQVKGNKTFYLLGGEQGKV
jgi:hypothetical protein